jgi:hypothetical protein
MTPLPPEQRGQFFVFVIESPSAADLYDRRSEGEIVRQAVELNGLCCVVKTAISLAAFDACLKVSLSRAMETLPSHIPLLHISAHGNGDGIQLSDGKFMSWIELKERLRPVNRALGGSLVVCMSSCQGYAGIRMAMHVDEVDLPYLALVGCNSMPSWGETAVAYATLYHQLWRGETIGDAVSAMRIASGNHDFYVEHAEQSRQAYVSYLKNINAAEAQQNLESIAAAVSPQERNALKALVR